MDTNQSSLYRKMRRIRMVEETIADRYKEQQMRCPMHLSIGQEAVAVGVCEALQLSDKVMSGHRSHAHYLAKGGELNAMIAELYGSQEGCCSGRGGSMHLIDSSCGFEGAVPIVGSTIPIATGLALSAKMQKSNQVVVAFLGEGATEEGVFHESVNFAVLKKLPILYVCENNLYSVYSPLSVRQPERSLTQLVEGHGIYSVEGNGNDVDEVKSLTSVAVERARQQKGPSFLMFNTYRWREHCGPNYDNHIGYRKEAEFINWKTRCPIAYAEDKLKQSSAWVSSEEDQYLKTIRKEIDAAFDLAISDPKPKPESLLEYIYAK